MDEANEWLHSQQQTKQLALVAGASAGIGHELDRQFGQNSFDLLIAAAGGRINSTAQELSRELGVQVQRCGRILFTVSLAGTILASYEGLYGATKVCVRSLSQSLREELKDTSVTALMPGATETEFFHRAGRRQAGPAKKTLRQRWRKTDSRCSWLERITL